MSLEAELDSWFLHHPEVVSITLSYSHCRIWTECTCCGGYWDNITSIDVTDIDTLLDCPTNYRVELEDSVCELFHDYFHTYPEEEVSDNKRITSPVH